MRMRGLIFCNYFSRSYKALKPKRSSMEKISLIVVLCVLSSALCIAYATDPGIQIVSDPTSLEGLFCPSRSVVIHCMAVNVSTLRWSVNATQVFQYTHSNSDTYPWSSETMPLLPGIEISITNAVPSPHHLDLIYVNSTLKTTILMLNFLKVQQFWCGTYEVRSAVNVDIGMKPPPPSPSTSCSLLSSPGGPEVTLQWSPSFTSQHAVERYRVAVNPDPSSCFSDQVSPSEDYSCSGLSLGTNYSITVSAINCDSWEGSTNTFSLQPQVPEIALASALYDGYPASLSVLHVKWKMVPSQCSRSLSQGAQFMVSLEDSASGLLVDNVTSNCTDFECQSEFQMSQQPVGRYYSVHVSILNTNSGQRSSPSVYPEIIPDLSDSLLNYTVFISRGIVFAQCTSPQAQNCSIEYTWNSLSGHQNSPRQPPVVGVINTTFPIMDLNTSSSFNNINKILHHQATAVLRSSLKVTVRRSLRVSQTVIVPTDEGLIVTADDADGSVKLEVYQLVLVVVVMVVLVISLMVTVACTTSLLHKLKRNRSTVFAETPQKTPGCNQVISARNYAIYEEEPVDSAYAVIQDVVTKTPLPPPPLPPAPPAAGVALSHSAGGGAREVESELTMSLNTAYCTAQDLPRV